MSMIGKRVVELLEFDKIVAMVKSHVASPPGKELAGKLFPIIDADRIRKRQAETTEGRRLVEATDRVPLSGIKDIRSILRKASIGTSIQPEECLDVLQTLQAATRLRRFFSRLDMNLPLMMGLVEGLVTLPGLQQEIQRCIGEDGQVLSTASAELASIRKQMRSCQDKIRETLQSVVRSSSYRDILQEPVVTLRNGRYVVPVKAERREGLPGIVHDRSASRQTLYVEPENVVELNNRLRELEAAERDEINRILAVLSGLVREQVETLMQDLRILARLDLIVAKGEFSRYLDGVEPEISNTGDVVIWQARHPLLGADAVPIDLRLGEEFRTLIITGPNTGGKTVTLKTLGLLVLMYQSGLHIPAAESSRLPVFSSICADIGDEQSIEQSLSTFSSHMKNIIGLLERASGPECLVLLDEIGAGTDPTEGAALAMAILQELHSSGVLTVATTHYSELKSFAYGQEGMENASVEFDVESLRPTYHLSIGLPGRSNAFEIAERLGLSADIVNNARQLLSRKDVGVEDMIRSIEQREREARQDRSVTARERNEVEKLKERYQQLVKDLQERRQSILDEAVSEARRLTRETRKQMERLIGELRKAAETGGEFEETASSVQAKLRQVSDELESKQRELVSDEREARTDVLDPEELSPGQGIFVRSLNSAGKILRLPDDGDEVSVQVGTMKVVVPVHDLKPIEDRDRDGGKQKDRRSSFHVVHAKNESISSELHLRGLTAEEAIRQTDKYLDDAFLTGLKQVWLIHGKGTGTLRQVIRDYLDNHPYVTGYRSGGQGEGGSGVTVVTIADLS